MRQRQGRPGAVRPAVHPSAQGAAAGRLLHGVHHGGRGRAALQPGHALLRRIQPRIVKQVQIYQNTVRAE